MEFNKPIKIAGIGLDWTVNFAQIYKDFLIELGYEAKIIELPDKRGILVAYSVISFSRSEAIKVLESLTSDDLD
jgi:hypothetical protein